VRPQDPLTSSVCCSVPHAAALAVLPRALGHLGARTPSCWPAGAHLLLAPEQSTTAPSLDRLRLCLRAETQRAGLRRAACCATCWWWTPTSRCPSRGCRGARPRRSSAHTALATPPDAPHRVRTRCCGAGSRGARRGCSVLLVAHAPRPAAAGTSECLVFAIAARLLVLTCAISIPPQSVRHHVGAKWVVCRGPRCGHALLFWRGAKDHDLAFCGPCIAAAAAHRRVSCRQRSARGARSTRSKDSRVTRCTHRAVCSRQRKMSSPFQSFPWKAHSTLRTHTSRAAHPTAASMRIRPVNHAQAARSAPHHSTRHFQRDDNDACSSR
jgi:hypothetical protein